MTLQGRVVGVAGDCGDAGFDSRRTTDHSWLGTTSATEDEDKDDDDEDSKKSNTQTDECSST